MISDRQVVLLMKRLGQGTPLYRAAAQSGMCERTAREYRKASKLPSECQADHRWRTRKDPFAEVWDEIRAQMKEAESLEAKTIFEALQRKQPGRFSDGQLRTLQRRIKKWRATEGSAKEVFFEQEHRPGELCQSDFTSMNELSITIAGQPFPHLFYHFVLTYSNWETGRVCFSESLESLSYGFQSALFDLGGVPQRHRSDRLSAAVNNQCVPEEFTQRYLALLNHYGIEGCKIQAAKPNENGDIEQRHHRFKRAVAQELLLRGNRDFASREEYAQFLGQLTRRLNAGRQVRLAEEQPLLRALPQRRLDACQRLSATVSCGSTVRVKHNTYSVQSRLIGEKVQLRLYPEQIEVWYAQQKVDTLPRLYGRYRRRINYRHIIEWLVRKPGAFRNYRYHDELFPSSLFRSAYDLLKQQHAPTADREYLHILQLAAQDGEDRVEGTLRQMFKTEQLLSFELIEHLVKSAQTPLPATQVEIGPIDLSAYDALLPTSCAEVVHE